MSVLGDWGGFLNFDINAGAGERRGVQRRGVRGCAGPLPFVEALPSSSSLQLSSLELSDSQVDEPYTRALLGT